MSKITPLIAQLRRAVGEAAVVTDHSRLRAYECDGLMQYRVVPAVAVFPTEVGHIQAIVRLCQAAQVPFVVRGSGTGLSGGSLPTGDGVLIVTTKMRAILELDIDNQRARLEPGVVNSQISRAAAPFGYYYAPDPSSQSICTIGGNVAENSGGAHCLKYGFTTHHVIGLQVVTPEGELVELGGGKCVDAPGYDLLGAFVGSEGTLGVVTEITVRLSRAPEAVHTVLIGFPSTDSAGDAVSAIIAARLLPAAIEMMDELAIEAAEAAVHCRYPTGAGAVLLVEIDGPAVDVEQTSAQVVEICQAHGAFECRIAQDEWTRAQFWKGRKSAFAAVGRISPNFLVQDGVIPRTMLSQVLQEISVLASAKSLRVANVFHAGDGNLHPLVLFDSAREGDEERGEALSGEIIDLCIRLGGSITGEHGVGVDKISYMAKMFNEVDLDAMSQLRQAFDPSGLCNPGKALPTPNLCGEATWRSRMRSA